MPAVATKETEEKGIARIQPMHLKGVEYISRDMSAMVEPNTTLEEVMHPEYWTHVAPRLREWGIIHCRWKDKTRYATLMVIETGQTWAKTRLIMDKQFEAPSDPKVQDVEIKGYKIQFIPNQGFRVTHKEKGTILQQGLATKVDAELFLERYIADLKA